MEQVAKQAFQPRNGSRTHIKIHEHGNESQCTSISHQNLSPLPPNMSPPNNRPVTAAAAAITTKKHKVHLGKWSSVRILKGQACMVSMHGSQFGSCGTKRRRTTMSTLPPTRMWTCLAVFQGLLLIRHNCLCLFTFILFVSFLYLYGSGSKSSKASCL